MSIADSPVPPGVADVLITHELDTRPSRAADYAAENEVLRTIARQMAGRPQHLLQSLAETALRLCRAGSAGVSLLEAAPQGEPTFRWVAAAGVLGPRLGWAAGEKSPCRTCLERGAPQLYALPGRYFAYPGFQACEEISETLFVPFPATSGVIGAIWVAAHGPERRFDREDVRVLAGLADFTSAALRIPAVVEENERLSRQVLEESRHRQRIDKALLEQGEQLRLVLDTQRLGTWQVDFASNVIDFSPQCLANYGLPPGTALTFDGHFDHIHPEDRPHVWSIVRSAIAKHTGVESEYRVVWPDGSVHWILSKGQPVYDDDGTPVSMVGITLDTTERRQAEAAARESERRLRFVMDSMPQMIFAAGPDGTVRYINPQWTSFTGLSLEQIRHGAWTRVVHPDEAGETLRRWRQCLATGEPLVVEHRLRAASGEHRWHITRVVGMRNRTGKVGLWVGSHTDVHELKQAQESLEEADRRKDEFLATLAHELRNPLTPIRTGLELIKRGRGGSASLEWVTELMEREVVHMVRLIDDLLDISRITQNKLELRRERVDLAEIVRQSIETVQPSIEISRQRLNVSLPPRPILLDADPVRLAQVVSNLLHNASKYTPEGGSIAVSLEAAGREAVVRVWDDGCGIRAEALPRIFAMFVQADSSKGGLGIGLTLARRLVEMHGGAIAAHSEGEGRGSEFVVTLPILAAGDERPTEIHEAAAGALARGHRILIVDDNRPAAETLAKLLSLEGYETLTAEDGLHALEAARTFRPDLVLMDIGMPHMNGYEAAQRMRERPEGRDVILVALTGWGQEEDVRRSLKAGFDHHLVKPADYNELSKLLAEVL